MDAASLLFVVAVAFTIWAILHYLLAMVTLDQPVKNTIMILFLICVLIWLLRTGHVF
jgi:hypothetical protein